MKGPLVMKRTALLISAFCLIALPLKAQSTIEYQSGTTIEVTSGADICADNVTISGSYSGSGTQCGGTLPVEMLSMTGVASSRSAVLTWTTATETGNAGFEIQRRLIEGPQTATQSVTWSTVGFVQGSGVSTSPKTYSFTDNQLQPGLYAYRLRQIDQNGSFKVTDAVEIAVGLAPREFTLSQNYPNPFNPSTTVEFTLEEDGHVKLSIYDAVGREIRTVLNEDRKAGFYQQVTMDLSRFGSGVYFYRLEANGRALTRKMLLVK